MSLQIVRFMWFKFPVLCFVQYFYSFHWHYNNTGSMKRQNKIKTIRVTHCLIVGSEYKTHYSIELFFDCLHLSYLSMYNVLLCDSRLSVVNNQKNTLNHLKTHSSYYHKIIMQFFQFLDTLHVWLSIPLQSIATIFSLVVRWQTGFSTTCTWWCIFKP